MEPTGSQIADTIAINPHPSGRGYRLETTQFLPQPRDRVFEFFADAFQLETLTPSWLHFSVLTPAPIEIASGTLIDYRLRLRGLPIRWQSVIRDWEPPFRFVDEQTRGPYRRWHHEHQFESVTAGTLCRDIVDYDVYGGALINKLLVRRDLERIFTFRQSKLRVLFSTATSTRETNNEHSLR
ncbi:MAG TPA: SRPBCC family protein [Lacipirellulaceae bacterium]|jgi:ligand-binding SRPBCC domain-containing protein|nr:SRPBCC family protein [Lacipirellulaceae bacterium]